MKWLESQDSLWRQAAAIGIVCVAALYTLSDAVTALAPDRFGASVQLDRLAPARRMIPSSEVIEFVSDIPASSPLNSMLFFTTQYALAPRLLVDPDKVQKARWAVGDFAHPDAVPSFAQARAWKIAADLQGGVVLFDKIAGRP